MKYPGKGTGRPKGFIRRLKVLMMLAVLSGLLALSTAQAAVTTASVSGEGGQLGPQAIPSDLTYLPPEVTGRYVFYGYIDRVPSGLAARTQVGADGVRVGLSIVEHNSTTTGRDETRAFLRASQNSAFF